MKHDLLRRSVLGFTNSVMCPLVNIGFPYLKIPSVPAFIRDNSILELRDSPCLILTGAGDDFPDRVRYPLTIVVAARLAHADDRVVAV